MAGLIVELLSSYCSLFITLRNGLKTSEYEVHWLTDFPLMIYWARHNYGNLSQKKANKQV